MTFLGKSIIGFYSSLPPSSKIFEVVCLFAAFPDCFKKVFLLKPSLFIYYFIFLYKIYYMSLSTLSSVYL